jgi:hypothetical protein
VIYGTRSSIAMRGSAAPSLSRSRNNTIVAATVRWVTSLSTSCLPPLILTSSAAVAAEDRLEHPAEVGPSRPAVRDRLVERAPAQAGELPNSPYID